MDPFLTAVIDTLLPGDAVLPSGTRAGVTLTGSEPALALLDRAAFVAAAQKQRDVLMLDVAATHSSAFRALLMPLLQDYCESDAVLQALGWRGGAPQPHGHALAAADADTMRLLDAVRQRGPIWRRG
jgi:hypothetical protein